MKCANCSFANRDGVKFRENCGTSLAQSCSKCGASLSSQAKFCGNCGAPVALAPSSTQAPQLKIDRLAALRQSAPPALQEKIRAAGSQMDATSKMGFNLVDQFNPRLIIPTHNDQDAAKLEVQKWPALYTDADFALIDKSELTSGTRILFLGASGRTYGRFVKAAQVDW